MNRFFRCFCIKRSGSLYWGMESCASQGGIRMAVWVPYITIQAVPILASNSWRYSYLKNDSSYQRYRESPTPRIVDTGSRYLKKKISLAQKIRLIAMSL